MQAQLLRVELLQAQQQGQQQLGVVGRGGSAGSSRRVPKLGKRPADERAHLRLVLGELQVSTTHGLLSDPWWLVCTLVGYVSVVSTHGILHITQRALPDA